MNKKIFIYAGALILMMIYVARVCYVNFNYDKPQIITYDKGDICQYGDFSFCMQTKQFMTYNEITELYGSSSMGNQVEDEELFLVVGFDVTYNGDKSEETPKLSGVCFQSGSWSNGEEYPMLSLLNPEGRSVKRGETKRLYLAASLNWQTFAKKEFPDIRKRQYNMTLATYPDVIRMRCE